MAAATAGNLRYVGLAPFSTGLDKRSGAFSSYFP